MHDMIPKYKTVWQSLLFTLGAFLLYNCDVLESDVAPKPNEIEVVGNKVYIMENGTGTIDLRSLVQSSGSVQLNVTSQPLKGELSTILPGLLQYSPHTGFSKGKDSFRFSVYSASNTLLMEDSVIIIVEDDSTNLPCGIYAQNDFFYTVTSKVTLDVLLNDSYCIDSTKLGIEIFRPEANFPPYFGTAQVVNNRIEYTPGATYQGNDKIVYKVFNKDDHSVFSVAVAYIAQAQPCNFRLGNDYYHFSKDSLNQIFSDTLQLQVFQNDQLCQPINDFSFSIIEDGYVGTASYGSTSPIQYRYPSPITKAFSDSVVYQLCYDGQCKSAKVYITVQ